MKKQKIQNNIPLGKPNSKGLVNFFEPYFLEDYNTNKRGLK